MPDLYAASPRTLLGKNVARMRKDGMLPANVFGRGLDSAAIQLTTKDARELLKIHGLNTLVNLHVEGEPAPRPVVVRHVQRHAVSHDLQHVDFYQVDLERRIEAHLSVVVIGTAPAVQTYQGVLLHGADTVVVSALPAFMPPHLEVSVDGITELDGQVTAADLTLPAGVTLLSPPDVMLARVSRPRVAVEGAVVAEGEQAAAPAAAATP
jgi:large subunit ribosomal protein L25